MKKRILAMIFAAFMAMSMAGCSNNGPKSDTDNASTQGSASNAVEVEKNLLSVEFTIPANYIDSVDDTLASAEEKGYKATANDDGSITYKLTKAQHAEVMDEISASLDESIDDLVSSGEYASLKEINFNEDYTKADVVVDYDTYTNSMDMFSMMAIGMCGPLYQMYNGVPEDKINTEVSLIDETSGDVMDTMNYPADFNTGEE